MDGVFEDFLKEFFTNLSASDLIRVLSEKGKRAVDFFAGKNDTIFVSYSGILAETAREISSSVLGKNSCEYKEAEGFQGLIFTGPGGAYRYRLTVDELKNELREYHRQEIMDALWKERN
jgi:hypothetical protein